MCDWDVTYTIAALYYYKYKYYQDYGTGSRWSNILSNGDVKTIRNGGFDLWDDCVLGTELAWVKMRLLSLAKRLNGTRDCDQSIQSGCDGH